MRPFPSFRRINHCEPMLDLFEWITDHPRYSCVTNKEFNGPTGEPWIFDGASGRGEPDMAAICAKMRGNIQAKLDDAPPNARLYIKEFPVMNWPSLHWERPLFSGPLSNKDDSDVADWDFRLSYLVSSGRWDVELATHYSDAGGHLQIIPSWLDLDRFARKRGALNA
jgi:hypothetical protein